MLYPGAVTRARRHCERQPNTNRQPNPLLRNALNRRVATHAPHRRLRTRLVSTRCGMHCADASVPDNLSVRSSVGARGAGQPSMDPEMRSLATSAHGWPAAQGMYSTWSSPALSAAIPMTACSRVPLDWIGVCTGPRPIIIPANDTEMLVESAFLGKYDLSLRRLVYNQYVTARCTVISRNPKAKPWAKIPFLPGHAGVCYSPCFLLSSSSPRQQSSAAFIFS